MSRLKRNTAWLIEGADLALTEGCDMVFEIRGAHYDRIHIFPNGTF